VSGRLVTPSTFVAIVVTTCADWCFSITFDLEIPATRASFGNPPSLRDVVAVHGWYLGRVDMLCSWRDVELVTSI
jgi:hypothetical protein